MRLLACRFQVSCLTGFSLLVLQKKSELSSHTTHTQAYTNVYVCIHPYIHDDDDTAAKHACTPYLIHGLVLEHAHDKRCPVARLDQLSRPRLEPLCAGIGLPSTMRGVTAKKFRGTHGTKQYHIPYHTHEETRRKNETKYRSRNGRNRKRQLKHHTEKKTTKNRIE